MDVDWRAQIRFTLGTSIRADPGTLETAVVWPTSEWATIRSERVGRFRQRVSGPCWVGTPPMAKWTGIVSIISVVSEDRPSATAHLPAIAAQLATVSLESIRLPPHHALRSSRKR